MLLGTLTDYERKSVSVPGSPDNIKSHDDQDYCVMDYASNFSNGITEFAIECLMTGTAAGTSLRDRGDK